MISNNLTELDRSTNYFTTFRDCYTDHLHDTTTKKTYSIMLWVFSILCPLIPAIGFFACWIVDLCIQQPTQNKEHNQKPIEVPYSTLLPRIETQKTPTKTKVKSNYPYSIPTTLTLKPKPSSKGKPVATIDSMLPTLKKTEEIRLSKHEVFQNNLPEILLKASHVDGQSVAQDLKIYFSDYPDGKFIGLCLQQALQQLLTNEFSKLPSKDQLSLYTGIYSFFNWMNEQPCFPEFYKHFSLDLFQPFIERCILPAFKEINPEVLPTTRDIYYYFHERLFICLTDYAYTNTRYFSLKEVENFEKHIYELFLIEDKQYQNFIKKEHLVALYGSSLPGRTPKKIIPGSSAIDTSFRTVLEKVIQALYDDAQYLYIFYGRLYGILQKHREEFRLRAFPLSVIEDRIIPSYIPEPHVYSFYMSLYNGLITALENDLIDDVMSGLGEIESLIKKRETNSLEEEITFAGQTITVLPGQCIDLTFETFVSCMPWQMRICHLPISKQQAFYTGMYQFFESRNREFPLFQILPMTVTEWLAIANSTTENAEMTYGALQELFESELAAGEGVRIIDGKIFRVKGIGDSPFMIASFILELIKVLQLPFMENIRFLVNAEKFLQSRGGSFEKLPEEPAIPVIISSENSQEDPVKIHIPLSRFASLDYFIPLYSGLYKETGDEEFRFVFPFVLNIDALSKFLSTSRSWEPVIINDLSIAISLQIGLELLGSRSSLKNMFNQIREHDLLKIQSIFRIMSNTLKEQVFSLYIDTIFSASDNEFWFGCFMQRQINWQKQLYRYMNSEDGWHFFMLPDWMLLQFIGYIINTENISLETRELFFKWTQSIEFQQNTQNISHTISYEVYQSLTHLSENWHESTIQLPEHLSMQHLPLLLNLSSEVATESLSSEDVIALQELKDFFGDTRPINNTEKRNPL